MADLRREKLRWQRSQAITTHYCMYYYMYRLYTTACTIACTGCTLLHVCTDSTLPHVCVCHTDVELTERENVYVIVCRKRVLVCVKRAIVPSLCQISEVGVWGREVAKHSGIF